MIRIGQGNSSTDTSNLDNLVPIVSTDYNQNNVYELTRQDIEDGKVFFVANPSSFNIGKSVDIEFFVKDDNIDTNGVDLSQLSAIPGLIRITIQEAPFCRAVHYRV